MGYNCWHPPKETPKETEGCFFLRVIGVDILRTEELGRRLSRGSEEPVVAPAKVRIKIKIKHTGSDNVPAWLKLQLHEGNQKVFHSLTV